MLMIDRAVRMISRTGAVARWAKSRATNQTKEESGRHDQKKGTEKGAEQRLAPVDASADLENRSITEQRPGDNEFAARILGNLQPGVLAGIVFVDRLVGGPDPVLGRHQQENDFVAGP